MTQATPSPEKQTNDLYGLIVRVFRENWRDYRGAYIVVVVCLLAIAASTAFIAWITGDVVDELFANRRLDLIPYVAAAIAAAFVVRGMSSYIQSVTFAKIGNNVVARYQRRIFSHLMSLGLDYYAENRSGALAARINMNIMGIRDLIGLTLTTVARDVVGLVALVGVMVWQEPLLSIFALLIGPPLVLSVNYLGRRVRSISRDAIDLNARLIGAMQEATQGVAVVKAYTMEDELASKLNVLAVEAEERTNKMSSVTERLGPITEALAGFAIAGVVSYAAWRTVIGGQSPGSVFSFITALLLAYDPARRLARVQVDLERSMVNARMIYELLDMKPRQNDAPGAVALIVGQGEVVFDKVDFGYAKDLPVVSGVSFQAEAGKTTAIVGASGAGKSTLLALLERFYDLDGGAILIDGQDIEGVTKKTLRDAMAYVSQQPYLFEGTVADNIRYGRPGATDADIQAAARLAAAHEFISELPAGYNTYVGENGVTLSGGQRQRLSIARAIIRNAPILLLDEATSALDNESEARVQTALDNATRNRTTIVIAHRLSTIVNAHKIVVMEAGRIIEQGDHATLLAMPDGVYNRLYRFQLSKAEEDAGRQDDAEPDLQEAAVPLSQTQHRSGT